MTPSERTNLRESRHDRRRDHRRRRLLRWARTVAPDRERWIERNRYYYDDERRFMRFLVSDGKKVLELGCGNGQLLAALDPSVGVGVDISPEMIELARSMYPELQFIVGDIEDECFIGSLDDAFDVIILSDAVGYLEDCQHTLALIQPLCHRDTRVIISYFSQAWRPFLKVAEILRLKMPQPPQNWLNPADISNLLAIEGFEPIKWEWRQLLPRYLGGLGPFTNRYLGTLPLFRRFSLRHYVVARSLRDIAMVLPSASVVIPCRNEAGNIEAAIRRLPAFCSDMEIVFVEGHSKDETVNEIRRVIDANPDLDIKLVHQEGRGKGDAVRKGFDVARGDILIILDADLTVAPEDMGKFYDAIASGTGNYAHGTRLVYSLEPESMRLLNILANHAFARLFSWLLNQRITDTLCGTKALSAEHYRELAQRRAYFGDLDPYGDFDLIFGAAKLNLKMVEIPVRYADRSYGTTQISRFKDGVLLTRMVLLAFRKLKAV